MWRCHRFGGFGDEAKKKQTKEQEYLRLMVAKIRALRPTLIIVSGNSDRDVYQALYQGEGASVVPLIEVESLARIARVTGATIVESTEELGEDSVSERAFLRYFLQDTHCMHTA